MKQLPLSLLLANEVFITSKSIDDVIASSLSDDPFISKIRPLLLQGINNLAAAMSKVRSSKYTKLLEQADNLRDTSFIGFRDICKAFSNHPQAEKTEAAVALLEIIQNRGWSLHRDGYTEQTANLDLLISDLLTPQAAQFMETIAVQSWFQPMLEAQQSFESMYQEKVSAESQEDYPLIKSARQEVNRYLDVMLNYIDVNSDVEPEKFQPIVQQIDEIITDVVTIARARQTRKENELVEEQ